MGFLLALTEIEIGPNLRSYLINAGLITIIIIFMVLQYKKEQVRRRYADREQQMRHHEQWHAGDPDRRHVNFDDGCIEPDGKQS